MDATSLQEGDRMATVTLENLKFTSLGKDIWHCDNLENEKTYRIIIKDGTFACNCPSFAECKHIKGLKKTLESNQAFDRRKGDLPSPLNANLERLIQVLSPKPVLGFGNAPRSEQWIFCNRKHGGLWYSLDANNCPIVLPHGSLTGYFRKLEFTQAKRRNQECWKLHATIEADRTYILESGHDSHFSKGLLSAIATLPPEALSRPITIVPQASTQVAEVLFCNVWVEGAEVLAPYSEASNWREIGRTAVDAVKTANS
jgi:hypothetical protein